MRNYVKPDMDLSRIELIENIASKAGLADWLESAEGLDYADVRITEYEFYS